MDKKYIGILGILVGSILLAAPFLLIGSATPPGWSVGASETASEVVNPGDFPGLTHNYTTALTEANDQLDSMEYGGIQTINGSSAGYSIFLVEDYLQGDILYWQISDEFTTVYLKDDTEEIIYYDSGAISDTSVTSGNIDALAANIAGQFATLPSDKSSLASLKRDLGTMYDVPSDPNDYPTYLGTDEINVWSCIWNRTKNGITSSDHIYLTIADDGDLTYYEKVWWMDLVMFSTSNSVSEATAKGSAEDYIEPTNATADDAWLMIVYPNDAWAEVSEDPYLYNTEPTLVWIVEVGCGNGFFWVWINANDEDDICGGDAYFADIPDFNPDLPTLELWED